MTIGQTKSIHGYNSRVSSFRPAGKALAALRNAAGLSQEVVAERMGLANKSNVSAIEGGQPSSNTIDRYLDALGATAHDLARALDQVNGRAVVAPEMKVFQGMSVDSIRDAYPGAPEMLYLKFRTLLAQSDVASARLAECIEEIRTASTTGGA